MKNNNIMQTGKEQFIKFLKPVTKKRVFAVDLKDSVLVCSFKRVVFSDVFCYNTGRRTE